MTNPNIPAGPPPAPSGAVDRLIAGHGVERQHVAPAVLEAEKAKIRALRAGDRRTLAQAIITARRRTADAEVHAGLDQLHATVDPLLTPADRAIGAVTGSAATAADSTATTQERAAAVGKLTLIASPFVLGGGLLIAAAAKAKDASRTPAGSPARKNMSPLAKILLATGLAGGVLAVANVAAGKSRRQREREAADARGAAAVNAARQTDGSAPLEALPPGTAINGQLVSVLAADGNRRAFRLNTNGTDLVTDVDGRRYGLTLKTSTGEETLDVTQIYTSPRGGIRFYSERAGGLAAVSLHLDKPEMERIDAELRRPGTRTEIPMKLRFVIPKTDIKDLAGQVAAKLRSLGAREEGPNWILNADVVIRPQGPSPAAVAPAAGGQPPVAPTGGTGGAGATGGPTLVERGWNAFRGAFSTGAGGGAPPEGPRPATTDLATSPAGTELANNRAAGSRAIEWTEGGRTRSATLIMANVNEGGKPGRELRIGIKNKTDGQPPVQYRILTTGRPPKNASMMTTTVKTAPGGKLVVSGNAMGLAGEAEVDPAQLNPILDVLERDNPEQHRASASIVLDKQKLPNNGRGIETILTLAGVRFTREGANALRLTVSFDLQKVPA